MNGGAYRRFDFPRAQCRDVAAIRAAFAVHGLEVHDVSWEMHGMLTWVLDQRGELWCNDASHGGGGYFSREGYRSNQP